MFICSCSSAPLCLDRYKIRSLGLDEVIRLECVNCIFGEQYSNEEDVPYGVWYTSDKEDL